MALDLEADFFALRRCFREPIAEIDQAARLLASALEALLQGDRTQAVSLVAEADMPEVRAWTESLWGSRKANPDQWRYHRDRKIANAPPHLPKDQRVPVRMPSPVSKRSIVARDGRQCAFCGIPLIRGEVRTHFSKLLPEASIWGRSNATQHAAFQCMWMQFDHLIPHSRGGDNALENVVVTCAPCNFGRMHWTIEEVGLVDPRNRPNPPSTWDGLERVLEIETLNQSPQ